MAAKAVGLILALVLAGHAFSYCQKVAWILQSGSLDLSWHLNECCSLQFLHVFLRWLACPGN